MVLHRTYPSLVGRLVVVMCNVIPANKRGIPNNRALLLCAKSKKIVKDEYLPRQPDVELTDRLEFLMPPPCSVLGDRIEVEGFPFKTPVQEINQDSEVFKNLSEDLRINSKRQATYRGIPLTVKGKGFLFSDTLVNCPISFE